MSGAFLSRNAHAHDLCGELAVLTGGSSALIDARRFPDSESYVRVPSTFAEQHVVSRLFRLDEHSWRLERAIGVVYRPGTELYSHYFEALLSEQFDCWVWFEQTSAVTPLGHERPRTAARSAGDLPVRPVTRPSGMGIAASSELSEDVV